MARLLIPLLFGLTGSVGACASAPTDLEGWPAATRAIRSGLEQRLDDLTSEASAFTDAAEAGPARAAWQRIAALAPARVAAWRALEDYCGRVLPVLAEAPYDGRGVRAVAESWRALVDALPGVSAASTAQRDETARLMIRANTTTSALQAADEAVARLGEDLLAFHGELSEAVTAAGLEVAAVLQEQEVVLAARRDTLREIILAAEMELRKEAAGAGVARQGAQDTLDANRPELSRVEEQLAAAGAARAAVAGRFAAAAEHVKRTGFAAREWAVAQREAGQALRKGLPEANFRLLQASAAELGPRPAGTP